MPPERLPRRRGSRCNRMMHVSNCRYVCRCRRSFRKRNARSILGAKARVIDKPLRYPPTPLFDDYRATWMTRAFTGRTSIVAPREHRELSCAMNFTSATISSTNICEGPFDQYPDRRFVRSQSTAFYDFLMAANTLGGVKGTERSRTPIALNTALLIAPGTIAAVGSPAPQGT